jgi:hypothetical protein
VLDRNATYRKGMYARHCCVRCAFAGGTTGSKDRQHVWGPAVAAAAAAATATAAAAAELGVELGAAAAARG